MAAEPDPVHVERWDPERDGAPSEQALRRRLEARGYQVARYVYPPGTVFPEHTHDVDKIDGVLSGRFRMTLREGQVELGPGDCLAVPRGTPHRAEVVGDDPVVSLDATRDRRRERGGSAQPRRHPQDRRHQAREQQAGGDGDVQAEARPLDADVAGQPTQPRQLGPEAQHQPQHREQDARDHQRPAQ